jgi:SAM-dependent methyltransferase
MDQTGQADPTYVLGRSEAETRRLAQQAELFEQPTRLVFEQAGIAAGMRVLDVGSGSGDVAFLVADMVGTTGTVVGVDQNPAIVEVARERARSDGVSNVSFVAGDMRELAFDEEFDAVVGRMVLMYQADPAGALRAAIRALRDGGIGAFFEGNVTLGVTSYPVSPLHQLLGRCFSETFARGGVELAMGLKLHQTFLSAGLPEPQLLSTALSGGQDEWVARFAEYGANTLRSLLPLILEYGIATEDELALDTFEQRYCDEVLGRRSVVQWIPFVGAWSRKQASV